MTPSPINIEPSKRDYKEASKLLEKLESLSTRPVQSATISMSMDGTIAYSDQNLELIASALAERTERDARIVEAYGPSIILKGAASQIHRGEA